MRKILIADDEPAMRFLIAETLKMGITAKILEAKDGEEALKIQKKENPEIIVLDVNMPKLSGYEVIEQIQKKDNCPVIVMLSADIDKKTNHVGIDYYFEKPFLPMEFLKFVKGILEK